MGKADESLYAINLTSNSTTKPSNASLRVLSPSRYSGTLLLNASFNRTVKRKRRHKISQQIDNTPNSKRFNNSLHENDNGLDENMLAGKVH